MTIEPVPERYRKAFSTNRADVAVRAGGGKVTPSPPPGRDNMSAPDEREPVIDQTIVVVIGMPGLAEALKSREVFEAAVDAPADGLQKALAGPFRGADPASVLFVVSGLVDPRRDACEPPRADRAPRRRPYSLRAGRW